MKLLLTAINAKYIHSNLAVYSLRAYAKEHLGQEDLEIELAEYTINQQPEAILMDLYERKADIYCFSCYIWNISYVELLLRELAKICPGVFWLGGPEVSYDAAETLLRLPQVKGIMKGEGEQTFLELCRAYASGEAGDADFGQVEGITFRSENGGVIERPWRQPMNLSEVPFVYQELQEFEHKILYYETSRGCPFSCSYCLSSIDKKLRFRDVELVKKELQFFLDHQVPQVKFVDRTFNCRHSHAMEIWSYLAAHDNGVTNFHFEISADLLKEEELQLLSAMRPGLVQLEIGVQSTNSLTLREIHRAMNFEKLAGIVNRIRENGNIHQHLDLIAGLPFEDILSFARSFDDVYALKPQQLQLGFLKVLKGSYMQEHKEAYQLVCQEIPPYEVLYTKWLTYGDILRLKGVEEMVEIYYNSRQFEYTIEELEREFASAFQMYEELWLFYKEKQLHQVQHKRSARYEIFLGFVREKFPQKEEELRELLIYDYYLRENAKTRPEFAGEPQIPKDFARGFYESESKAQEFLEGYEQYDRNQIRKMTHLEYLESLDKLVLFDYQHRNPLTQEARVIVLDSVIDSCKNMIKSIKCRENM